MGFPYYVGLLFVGIVAEGGGVSILVQVRVLRGRTTPIPLRKTWRDERREWLEPLCLGDRLQQFTDRPQFDQQGAGVRARR
jgi:hypothetical protein